MSTVQQHVFDNISRNDYLGFQVDHDVDYKKVVKFLDFSTNDISKISGVSKASVRYDQKKIPKEVRDRILEIANICQLVAEFFGGDVGKTALWFKTSNPLLGNLSPRDMIRIRKYNKLLRFVMDAREGAKIGRST